MSRPTPDSGGPELGGLSVWPPDGDACLALEDGRLFFGRAFGAPVDVDGEVVFNTSMAGYQEIATDPSYRGQMVVLTHPQVGNYGVQAEASESTRPWLTALIVRDLAPVPSHWLAAGDLSAFLATYGVPGLAGVDTRALTRHLQTFGTMRAALGRLRDGQRLADLAPDLVRRAREATPLSDKNLVAEVSDPHGLDRRTDRDVPALARSNVRLYPVGAAGIVPPVRRAAPVRIALVDCGVKHHIARSLVSRGAEVVAIPWDAGIEQLVAAHVQGVVVSNGPGDPERMDVATRLVQELLHRAVPTLGICLGHQVLGLAAGGTTSRLKFGHHGGNHPVRDLATGRIHITSQNHEFQVDGPSIPEASGFVVSMVNLNDQSVEGLAHRELPAFSVQYHPEGCPGPQDNQHLFERFLSMVERPIAGTEALAGPSLGP